MKYLDNQTARDATPEEIESAQLDRAMAPSAEYSDHLRLSALESAAGSKYRIIPDTIAAVESFDEGELGWWNGELWQSLLDANVWTPEQYPTGWQKCA